MDVAASSCMKCYIYNSSPIGSQFKDFKGRTLRAIACHLFAKPFNEHRK